MSINYFPMLYEDELLYSALARYHAHSGNISYAQTAELLFINPRNSPSVEFIPPLTDGVLNHLLKQKSIQKLIMEHTLFPYYGRFLPTTKRKTAFSSLCAMENNARLLVEMPKNASKTAYLRYCPFCVKEDREKHGETFWHRSHQLAKVIICPTHHCFLNNSNVKILKNDCSLYTAELYCTSTDTEACSDFDDMIADYILSVFHSPINMDDTTDAGDFLQYKLIGTPYLHKLGNTRYVQKLTDDFLSFYKSSCMQGMSTRTQIDTLLRKKRFTPFDICQLAFFLGISSNELSNMKTESIDLVGKFRTEINELLSQGYIYQQIAEITGISRSTVQNTLHPKEKAEAIRNPNKRNGCLSADWEKVDTETLPLLKTTIEQFQNTDTPPVRITKNLIATTLDIPYKSLDKMPLCKAEILKHTETLEEYGARKLTWAFNKMMAENVPITYGRIQSYIYVKRQRLYKYMPYLDDEMKQIAETLM